MFKPQCMPFNVVDGKPVQSNKEKPVDLAYVQGEHILPCVWCNRKVYRDELQQKYGLMDTKLRLSNNQSIYSILKTPQWQKFVDDLAQEKNLMQVCVERCKDV